MRISVELPEALVEEAKEVSGAKTITQAIVLALSELVQRWKNRRILELKDSLKDFYDYKPYRR